MLGDDTSTPEQRRRRYQADMCIIRGSLTWDWMAEDKLAEICSLLENHLSKFIVLI